MLRSVDKWFWGYLKSVLNRPSCPAGTKHLMFCLADHFEPSRGGSETVQHWVNTYPSTVEEFRDSDGKCPQHTFFFPEEEYSKAAIDELAGLCGDGFGEVEIHLHHRNDTADGLREKLNEFKRRLREDHGLLGHDAEGNIRYGFIHGNWALCNSRPDGDWCGVNEEIRILTETGCYADFTFPSAPSPTQPRMVNTIYRAQDNPGQSRSHDTGVPVKVKGRCPDLDSHKESQKVTKNKSPILPFSHSPSLLMIPGPLALNWEMRKWGILPRLENAAIAMNNPPVSKRVDLWVKQHIHITGRPEWVFVKVHTHGCDSGNIDVILGEAFSSMHQHLQKEYNDGEQWRLHYVTAREMYNIVRATEDGQEGDPGEYRDYEVFRPVTSGQ